MKNTITPIFKIIISSLCLFSPLVSFFSLPIYFNKFLVVIIELYPLILNFPYVEVKSNPAYYLLILYTLAMCKPVLPLIQDELAHIFLKAEHIATVHHHHGDDHAEEAIAEAAHEEKNDTNPATSKTSEPVSIHLFSQLIDNIPQPFIKKEKYVITVSSVSIISLDKHYPPPKSC